MIAAIPHCTVCGKRPRDWVPYRVQQELHITFTCCGRGHQIPVQIVPLVSADAQPSGNEQRCNGNGSADRDASQQIKPVVHGGTVALAP